MAADGLFDRRSVLDSAQRLVQQNKVPQAIEAYEQLVRHDPSDWSSANTLGDLLVRARLVDQAIREYLRIADYLAGAGFLARAGAIYKKVLRLDPQHVDALRQTESVHLQRFAKPGGQAQQVQEPVRVDPEPPAMNPAPAEPMRLSFEPTSQTESVAVAEVDSGPAPASPSAAVVTENDQRQDCAWSLDQPDPSPA